LAFPGVAQLGTEELLDGQEAAIGYAAQQVPDASLSLVDH